MFNTRILSLVLLCIQFNSHAQTADTLGTLVADGWIEKMDNFLSLKLSVSDDAEVFSVDTETNDFELYPNTSTVVKLGFHYRFLSFSLKMAPEFLPGNNDTDTRGKTSGFGLGMGFIFRHWFQDVFFTKTKGYYLNNTSDYVPGWSDGDPYLQFPDLRYWGLGGLTGYSFNPRFSVRSLITQTERQLKSAGTFVPIIAYRYYDIDNKIELQPGSASQQSGTFEIIAGAGYHYNYVVKEKLYFAAGLTPAIGYMWSKLHTRSLTETITTRSNNPLFRLDFRFGMGYNGPRFFTGLYLSAIHLSYNQENTTVVNQDTRVQYQIFIGYRLNAPTFLKTQIDKAESYMPR